MTIAAEPVGAKALAGAYLHAKRAVIRAGYEAEIAWQEEACWAPLTEARFLSEAAWVVLSSGMREVVVRRIFPEVAEAFGGFVSAGVTTASAALGGRDKALSMFRHAGKIDAIISIASHVDDTGFDEVRRLLRSGGTDYLQTLPFIGPVTAFHLAKNLGHDVAKPDRHLTRIARACGFDSPHAMCALLAEVLGEPVPVVDIVLWRFATLSTDYLAALVPGPTWGRPSGLLGEG